MNRLTTALALLLSIQSFALGQGGKQTPEQKALVQKVFDAWKKRRSQFGNVRYKAKGTVFWPKRTVGGPGEGQPGQPVAIGEATVPREVSILLDFTTKRHRLETKETLAHLVDGSWVDCDHVSAFDGKRFVQLGPIRKESGPQWEMDGFIVTGNLRWQAPEITEWAFYMAHGIINNNDTRIIPGKWAPKLDQSEFYIHAQAKHQGRECVVIRTEMDHFTGKAFNEYWVDAASHLVLRQAIYNNGKMSQQIDLRYGDGPNFSLESWRCDFLSAGKFHSAHEMRVESFAADKAVSEDEFRIVFQPGMKVKRVHNTGSEDSLIPSRDNTEQMLEVAPDGELVALGGVPPPSEKGGWLRIAGAGFLALLVVALSVFCWRRWRPAHSI